MKLKWQWFLGGRVMFWLSIILFIVLVIGFISTYIIDPLTTLTMKPQKLDNGAIKTISEAYVDSLGLKLDKPVVYRFTKFNYNLRPDRDEILLGTFHEWNGRYYIDISIDLYGTTKCEATIIHETRHMIVVCLKNNKIIDLTKYTEEIAQEKNPEYNKIFDASVVLLNNEQQKTQ